MRRSHGGSIVDRILSGAERERAVETARDLPTTRIGRELAKDVENIAKGVFSPLEGFLCRDDFVNVLSEMRLANDVPWALPIVLDAAKQELNGIKKGDEIALTVDGLGPVALMDVEEIYTYDKKEMARQVFKTTDVDHPGVARVLRMKELFLGGKISLIRALESRFRRYALSPVETRVLFKAKGWRTIAGFQTRNVPHLGHEYVQKTALAIVDGIFINPVIGRKRRGDYKDDLILAAYDALIENYYLKDNAVMAILETEMRYAGPREAIFHAIVRRNFGCTHFVVGRDHAGVGDYYGPYEAQRIFDEFPDLGITPLFFKSFFYCRRCGGVANERTCPHSAGYRTGFSGTRIREMLMRGERPPKELMRPEVADIVLGWDDPFVE